MAFEDGLRDLGAFPRLSTFRSFKCTLLSQRYSGRSHSRTAEGLKEDTAENQRDRKFGNQLNRYFEEVIAVIRDADIIQIFGPGEAKGELKKRIVRDGLKANILGVESADKMTGHQIAGRVT